MYGESCKEGCAEKLGDFDSTGLLERRKRRTRTSCEITARLPDAATTVHIDSAVHVRASDAGSANIAGG